MSDDSDRTNRDPFLSELANKIANGDWQDQRKLDFVKLEAQIYRALAEVSEFQRKPVYSSNYPIAWVGYWRNSEIRIASENDATETTPRPPLLGCAYGGVFDSGAASKLPTLCGDASAVRYNPVSWEAKRALS